MKALGKKIEYLIHSYRSYFAPRHYASAKVVRSNSAPLSTEKPLCIFDFQSIRVDNVGGRYMHHIITDFEEQGYHICFTNRFRFLATFTEKTYKKLLLNHSYSIIPPAPSYPQASVVVTDVEHSPASPNQNVIVVDYEEKLPIPSERNAFTLPFFMHPRVHDSGQLNLLKPTELISKERSMKILFAGNDKYPTYDNPLLPSRYGILSRHRCLETLRQNLPTEQFYKPTAYENLFASPHEPAFTLSSYPSCKIPQKFWLETVAKSDFYLATPGVHMPFCHNLIEALAVGSIPILQYPQYLQPHLEHSKNCLVFDDVESLTAIVEFAMTASPDEIERLRKGAMQFYEDYLRPGSFAKKMLDHNSNKLTLYVNAYRVPHERSNSQ
jgi:hypothetical protein